MNDSQLRASPSASASSHSPTDHRSHPVSILLVDDQPARLLSYEAVLSGLGVNCVRSLSGEEALVRVLKQGQDLQRAQEEGFAVHLVKPVDGMQLNKAIAPAQEQRRWSS